MDVDVLRHVSALVDYGDDYDRATDIMGILARVCHFVDQVVIVY